MPSIQELETAKWGIVLYIPIWYKQSMPIQMGSSRQREQGSQEILAGTLHRKYFRANFTESLKDPEIGWRNRAYRVQKVTCLTRLYVMEQDHPWKHMETLIMDYFLNIFS